jgi:hypothetical protein
MPTTFWGLFLFSTGLSLVATFTAVSVTAIVKRLRIRVDGKHPRIR